MAQKFKNTTLPFRSLSVTGFPFRSAKGKIRSGYLHRVFLDFQLFKTILTGSRGLLTFMGNTLRISRKRSEIQKRKNQ